MVVDPIWFEKNINADLVRNVTVSIFYACEASAQRKAETGLKHSNILSENFIVMPTSVDTLDTKDLPTIRKLWMKSVQRQPDAEPPILTKDETVVEKFVRLLGQASSREAKQTTLSFIAAAKYPVPSEFGLALPEQDKGLRKEIIETLVPFIDTRKMLLRLEEALELPMRHINIGHTRALGVDELRATIN